MIIILGIWFVFSFILLLVHRCKSKTSVKSFMSQTRDLYSILASAMLMFLLGTIVGFGAKYDISINRECIPVHLEEFKVIYIGSEVYFDDGYGNFYVIPKGAAEVDVFLDSELRITSVAKITQRKTYSILSQFLIDFGLFTSSYEEFTELYELSVPSSKMVPVIPASKAETVPGL